MNPQAIAKLRRTFIVIAISSFLVVIAFMGATTVIANIVTLRDQALSTIDAIIDAGGQTPTVDNYRTGVFHEEATYGLRFFTISYDQQGEVTNIDLSHVALTSMEDALEASKIAADPHTLLGLTVYDNYLAQEEKTPTGSMAVFLDCSLQLAATRAVIYNTIILCLATIAVTSICIIFLSKQAIRPEVENARQQQQFITNASHELKTPIAVIRANTELTEMISGETEWTQSTLNQVNRLEGLVSDLMVIVRGEERGGDEQEPAEIDVSKVVGDAVESFRSVSQQQGLQLQTTIDKGVFLRGHASTVEQLTCLLMDNAMKYCDPGGTVDANLMPARIGRGCTLVVSNDYAEGANVDYHRFFDRFYRADESHENQQGYGIGLSVAESICEHYHGSIKVSWKAGRISFTCVLRGVS